MIRKVAAILTIVIAFSMVAIVTAGSDRMVHSADRPLVGSSIQSGERMSLAASPSISDPVDDPKAADMCISSVEVLPSFADVVYASCETTFRIKVNSRVPLKVDLNLDVGGSDRSVTYYPLNKTFVTPVGSEDFLSLLGSKSGLTYNSSSETYDIDLVMVFGWGYPLLGYATVRASITDGKEVIDEETIQSMFRLEKTVVLEGEIKVSSSDPEAITDDSTYIRGGSYLVLSGCGLHFLGNPLVAPDPAGFILSVDDDTGRRWSYIASDPMSLIRISFAFMMPTEDAQRSFSFKVTGHPVGSQVLGEAFFGITIDSTPPVLGDFRYDGSEENILSWFKKDDGAGIDRSSLEICIGRPGMDMSSWFVPERTDWDGDRLDIHLSGLSDGDHRVKVRLGDKVGNQHPEDLVYYFTTYLPPVHDLAIVGSIHLEPQVLVAGYDTVVRTRVKNLGTQDMEETTASLFLGETRALDLRVPAVPAGSIRDIRFTWTPGLSDRSLRIVLDPDGRLEDEDRSNNDITYSIEVHYRDLMVDGSTFTLSESEPDDMERVSVGILLRNIGDLRADMVRVRFLQDGRFYGEYNIDGIDGGSETQLTIDWKASHSARVLSFIVDPYNEISESIEKNHLDIDNPLYRENVKADDPIISGETGEDQQGQENVPYVVDPLGPEGSTIWIGPVTGERPQIPVDETVPDAAMPYHPTNDDMPLIVPVLVPVIGLTATMFVLGGVLAVMNVEPSRYRILGLLVPLYSKLKRSKIEHGTRYEILGYLKARPGAHYTELKDNLDLNDGSLVHHLRVLEKEDKIYSKRVGKYKLFYVTSYRRETSFGDYLTPFQKRILELILNNPGMVPKNLSRILDRSQTDISYHLTELNRNGILEKRKKGRNIQYFIRDEYIDMIMV